MLLVWSLPTAGLRIVQCSKSSLGVLCWESRDDEDKETKEGPEIYHELIGKVILYSCEVSQAKANGVYTVMANLWEKTQEEEYAVEEKERDINVVKLSYTRVWVVRGNERDFRPFPVETTVRNKKN